MENISIALSGNRYRANNIVFSVRLKSPKLTDRLPQQMKYNIIIEITIMAGCQRRLMSIAACHLW